MTKYQYIYVLQTNFKPNKKVVKPERTRKSCSETNFSEHESSPPFLPVGHLKFDIVITFCSICLVQLFSFVWDWRKYYKITEIKNGR